MVHSPASPLLIGAHTSAQGGVHQALLRGKEIGATTIQLFTSNQKTWFSKALPDEEVERWQQAIETTGLKQIMSHDSFLINLGSPSSEARQKSLHAFKEELHRCHQLELAFLNFHPGAALDSTEQECLERIIESLISIADLASRGPTRLLIEATAGQGSCVGHRFEHLSYLVDKLQHTLPIGVCIDTCHIFAAGYDIRTPEAWEATLKEFDQVVGVQHLYAFHVNDSQKPLGSRVDRHASIGQGMIGHAAFEYLMRHPRLREIPKYLETPEPDAWAAEIALLRNYSP